MSQRNSWKILLLVSLTSVILGIGLAARMDWIDFSEAQKAHEQFIFNDKRPSSFADLAKEVQMSVVNISTTKNFKIRRGPFYQFQEDYFQRYYRQPESELKRPNSLGSGFIIDQEGHILTNSHVVKGADEIQVKLSDGRSFQAQVIGSDPKSDLAVIKINTKESLPYAHLGNSDQLQIGDWVMAIGNPFGLTHTVTAGILSAKGRVIGAGPYDNFLQTDASINPGNSGGPLFNLKGEVVGVNTAIIQGGQGIGFAIPINMAKSVVPQLLSKGKVERAYLGIGLQPMSDEMAKILGLKPLEGVVVAQVFAGSPAHRAGIKAGDIIVKYKGKKIHHSQDLPIMVSQSPVGSEAEIELIRNGKTEKVDVILGSLEKTQPGIVVGQGNLSDVATPLGMAVRDVKPQERRILGLAPNKGVAITHIQRGSPAASVGLQPGDLIMEVNEKGVADSAQFLETTKKLRRGDMVRLFVRRGPLSSYFAFTL